MALWVDTAVSLGCLALLVLPVVLATRVDLGTDDWDETDMDVFVN